MPGFDGTDLPDWVRAALDDGLAGVALYGGNVGTEEAVGRLSAQVHAGARTRWSPSTRRAAT